MIGAVVLNFKTAVETVRTVKELRSEGVELVVVVDNMSGPSDLRLLKDQLSALAGVVLIEADTNGGYSVGNNRGLRYLLGVGCQTALVCNPDVHFPVGSVQGLVDGLSGSTVLVSPMMVTDAGEIDSNGGWWNYRIGRGELNEGLDGPLPRVGRQSTFNGACMVVNLARFADIGLFPEDQFLYGEEVDVALRLEFRGWGWSQVSVEVVHRRGGSVGSSANWSARSVTAHRYAAESAMIVTRKYWPRWLPAVVGARLALSVVMLWRRDVAAAVAVWRGVARGLRRPVQRLRTDDDLL